MRWGLGAVVLALAAGWARGRLLLVTVDGASMQPAVPDGARLLVRRSGPTGLRRGSVVVFQRPIGLAGGTVDWQRTDSREGPADRRWMVKRLVGLPGDPVPASCAAAAGHRSRVPAGTVLVLGDNLEESVDSRLFGPVPAERLLGVAVRRW